MTLLRQKLVGEQPTMTWLVGNTHCKKMGTFYSWPDQLSSSTSNKWTNSLEQTNFRVCKTFFLVHLWKFKIYFWRYQIERACILLKQRLIEKCLQQCSFKSFYQFYALSQCWKLDHQLVIASLDMKSIIVNIIIFKTYWKTFNILL